MLADPEAIPADDPRAELAPRSLTIIRDAMLANPEMVGGRHDRLDTSLMKAAPADSSARPGWRRCAASRSCPGREAGRSEARASGMAIKIEDGDGYDRGTWAASVEALRQAGVLDGGALRDLARYHRPTSSTRTAGSVPRRSPSSSSRRWVSSSADGRPPAAERPERHVHATWRSNPIRTARSG